MSNFVSYENANTLMTAIGQKFASVTGAFVFKGSIPFAELVNPYPYLGVNTGDVFNISDQFTTDARFLEGAGKTYSAGTNIAAAAITVYNAMYAEPGDIDNPSEDGLYELVNGEYVPTTDTTVPAGGKTYYAKGTQYYYDVLGNFVNVDGIYTEIDKVAEMVCATPFDSGDAYDIGDVVVYQRGLYEFTSAHTADDPWDASEVHKVDVLDLIASTEPDSLTAGQITALLALLD